MILSGVDYITLTKAGVDLQERKEMRRKKKHIYRLSIWQVSTFLVFVCLLPLTAYFSNLDDADDY